MNSRVLTILAIVFALWAKAGEIQDAAKAGDLPRVRALVTTAPESVNARDRGTTPLHEAARAGHLEVVRFLVEHGATVNTNDVSGATPLRLALGYRRTDVAAYLQQKGALREMPKPAAVVRTAPPASVAPAPSPAAPPPPAIAQAPAQVTQPPTPSVAPPTNSPTGETNPVLTVKQMLPALFPIDEAARIGDTNQILFLFKTSPEIIESTDEKGLTPLHIAVLNDHPAAVKSLLGLRAKVNARSDAGETPLHVAARHGNAAIAELLVASGADVNARDAFATTPLIAAVQAGDREEFRSTDLRRFSLEQRRQAAAAIQRDQAALVTLFVKHGADVTARNRAGINALQQAIQLGCDDSIITLLLRAGADPTVADPATRATPLHVAASRGMTNIILVLLQARAPINALDARGETPLAHACRDGHRAAAALLKQQGGTLGPQRTLSSVEQSLADFYQRTDAALQHASPSEKARLVLDMTPTRADVQKMFPRHAEQAWRVVDQVRAQVKQTFQRPVRDADEGKEIWRVRPQPCSTLAQDWISSGWLNHELPVLSLIVDRVGATSRPGDYCYVNQHWVLLPPLRPIILPQQAQNAAPARAR